MGKIDDALQQQGITLPTPGAPIANYVPCVISGHQLIVSGQLPLGLDGKLDDRFKGKLGATVSDETGREAAKLCAINVLAQARVALGGDLDRIVRCVRLGGFINAQPDYATVPAIMNGASDFMVGLMGDAGRHARSTVGVAVLPFNAAVEVEALFEIR
ncbi:RidA family protein [Lichenihabitans sp. Uapishka_5]|uniref:RidA family protein n=1 Tax=Lichenihabitans sp. Uapishka_5 TaxID=3037302 RepID=UPI0029E80304|nr:RidA family protein [Lichenihabitans sp. Uapishka_5]MDX7952229.1 RidA family protein [Lichenihabitans sp. Uapishka_5]